MIRYYFYFLFLLFLNFSNISYAQRTCGTDAQYEEDMKDPAYREFMKDIQRQVQDILKSGYRIPCSNGVYTFPVAVHYNWPGIPSTPDQCMIDAAVNSINSLNTDWAAMNSDLSNYNALTTACNTYYPASALSDNSCTQFCLAEFNHPGCSGLCDGDKAVTAGQFSYPNTGGCFTGYINIFVGIDDSGTLGVAPLNGVTLLNGNGPFIDRKTWGGPGISCTPAGLGESFNSFPQYNLGRTLTHEMGHYFGLEHPFAGDCMTDDGIADTPIQSMENGGKPVVVNCDPNDSANTAVNSCGTLDMWCSYMDYSDDDHLFMFTTDQSSLMYTNAQLAPNVADINVVCNGSPQPPTADFITQGGLPVFCSSDTAPYMIQFTDQSSRCPMSWDWSFSGAGVSPTSSTMQNPMVTVTMSGDLTITLTSTNAQGASVPVTKTIYVSIATPGSCPDCGDTFVDSGGPNANYSNNENNTWTYCADPGTNLVLNASLVDLPGGLFDDYVSIYDGMTASGTAIGYLGQNNGTGGGFWLPVGNNQLMYDGTTFTSPNQCLTFQFTSNASMTGAGWNVSATCCMPGGEECSMSNPPGSPFSATIKSACNTMTIFDLGNLKGEMVSESRSCPSSISYSNNAYYEVTCDSDGGDLTIDVSANANGGAFDARIMGPLSGTCPNYTSGNLTIAACLEGPNAVTLTEPGVAPNSRYLVFVNSENPGVFDISGSGTALQTVTPVEISKFSAVLINQSVLLKWVSLSEVNNDYFTLLKSTNGIDFTPITRIQGAGDSNSAKSYSYTDLDVNQGVTYYLLTQTDFDGSSKEVGRAKVTFVTDRLRPKFYPNPLSGRKIMVDNLSPSSLYTVEIINSLGVRMTKKINSDELGSTEIIMTGLPNGIYFIQISNDFQSHIEKLLLID